MPPGEEMRLLERGEGFSGGNSACLSPTSPAERNRELGAHSLIVGTGGAAGQTPECQQQRGGEERAGGCRGEGKT